ncbi:MAG: Maf family protein [Rickettsiales bacterium]|nr:Maf family protein [Rickettsiales bacterium]
MDFILGSGSKSRLELLEQAGFIPSSIEQSDIDESILRGEKALEYVKRVSLEKLSFLHRKCFGNIILSADTVGVMNGRILRKCKNEDEIERQLKMYSGRSIKVITSVCLVDAKHRISQKTVATSIKFKHFSQIDIKDYIKSKQWVGVAAGLRIEGIMESMIIKYIGGYSNVRGLPLYETVNMLTTAGVVRKV